MALGPELITNGTFDSDTSGWSVNAAGVLTWVSGGTVTFQRVSSANDRFYQQVSVTSGRTYRIRLDYISGTDDINFRLGTGAASLAYGNNTLDDTYWTYMPGLLWVAPVTGSVYLSLSLGANATVGMDNISMKEILDSSINLRGGFIN